MVSRKAKSLLVLGLALALLAFLSTSTVAGFLRFLGAQVDDVGEVDGLRGASSVAVSPDGRYVYGTGGYDDALAVFSRDPTTGTLTFIEAHIDGVDNVDGLNGVESVAASPDGKHVYTASWLDSAVAAFSRKDASGRLEFVKAVFHQITAHDGLLGASSVAVSPDGAHIYVGGRGDDAVVAFSRDAGSGQLTFIEAHFEGLGDVDGLWGVSAIALSPDGKYLYAAGETDSAIALFARDAVSGKLSFVEALFNGQGGLEGFARPSSLAISPNGSHLYVSTHVDPSRDDWIVAFSRNSATGKLEFVEAYSKDVVSGCDGFSISAASAIAMSPLGDHVFATTLDDAVAVFSRDPTTGKLTLIEEQCDGVAALIRQYTSIAASPDGMNLYVTSFMDDSLSEFQTPPAASLKLNYPTGQPGSFFTLTGQNFAADSKASIAVNQQVLGNVPTDQDGSFTCLLDTTNADAGHYAVTVAAGTSAVVRFELAEGEPLRAQEGDGKIFQLPAGIAYTHQVFLPIVLLSWP